MTAISPMSNQSDAPLDTLHAQADVYATRSALDAATAAIEQTGGPRDPVLASSGVKLDPRLARLLDTYVSGAQAGEDRATARLRIEAAIAQGANAKLSLKGLGLLTVPPVLPNVFSLDLSDNRISTLPTLPCGIQYLLLRRNRLRGLLNPLPDQLLMLDVSHNYLAQLPETLPSRLIRVDAQDNGLQELPKMLPRELRIFNVGKNRADLTQAAIDLLAALAVRRVFDILMGVPAVTALQTTRNLDARRCSENLDAQAVLIPPVPVRA